MKHINKREIPFERMLFFSDAVVAIAITLFALYQKLDLPDSHHLTFNDLILPWKSHLAFLLSFINIGSFYTPVLAFFLVFFKIPIFFLATLYLAKQRRREVHEKRK